MSPPINTPLPLRIWKINFAKTTGVHAQTLHQELDTCMDGLPKILGWKAERMVVSVYLTYNQTGNKSIAN
jgi:hypothetical protein